MVQNPLGNEVPLSNPSSTDSDQSCPPLLHSQVILSFLRKGDRFQWIWKKKRAEKNIDTPPNASRSLRRQRVGFPKTFPELHKHKTAVRIWYQLHSEKIGMCRFSNSRNVPSLQLQYHDYCSNCANNDDERPEKLANPGPYVRALSVRIKMLS